MSKLVLIGGGGHCKSVLDAALSMNKYDEIVITDYEIPCGTEIFGCKVVGTDEVLPVLRSQGYEQAFISVGSIKSAELRKKLVKMSSQLGFAFPNIIDPSAVVSPNAKITEGVFIGKNCVVNADVAIEKHCIINTGAILEHEVSVGEFSHVAGGCVICGNTNIGYESFIGAGSTIIQGVNIGNNVVVGAGSVVLGDIGDMKNLHGIVRGGKA